VRWRGMPPAHPTRRLLCLAKLEDMESLSSTERAASGGRGGPASPCSRGAPPGKGFPRPTAAGLRNAKGEGPPYFKISAEDKRGVTPHLNLAESLCTLSYSPLKWDTRPTHR